MRRVQCYDCGKRYDYDVDDFCPRCGAFTLPPRSARIGADGAVVRTDGINERYHRNSFVHAELHEENRERRGTRLESPERSRKVKAQSRRSGQSVGARLPQREKAGKLTDGLDAVDFLADIAGDVLSGIFDAQ